MLEKYIPKRFANALLKHVAAVTLFIPYFYSHNDNMYYQDFILAVFFGVLCAASVFAVWTLDFRRNAVLIGILSTLLLGYNAFAFYMNYKYHHWYADQINTTLTFLFLIALLLVEDRHALADTSVIKAIIHMIVLSNVLALMVCSLDQYERLFFMNSNIELRPYPWEHTYFSWLYGHKSQYSLLLVLCIAFFVVCRRYFRNRITYLLSLALLFVALYISGTYASMAAALLIFAGQFLDYLWRAKWWKKLLAVGLFPGLFYLVARELFARISTNRDLLSLGYRTYIWNTFTGLIRQDPNGINDIFGVTGYLVEEWGWYTSNCHNVFLNHMFRFSIPVGAIYALMFLVLVLFSLVRNFSFLTLGIWVALFIPMTMDHALSTAELPFFLLLVYLMFFRGQPQAVKKAGEEMECIDLDDGC